MPRYIDVSSRTIELSLCVTDRGPCKYLFIMNVMTNVQWCWYILYNIMKVP